MSDSSEALVLYMLSASVQWNFNYKHHNLMSDSSEALVLYMHYASVQWNFNYKHQMMS